jgi:hypothetical protein
LTGGFDILIAGRHGCAIRRQKGKYRMPFVHAVHIAIVIGAA